MPVTIRFMLFWLIFVASATLESFVAADQTVTESEHVETAPVKPWKLRRRIEVHDDSPPELPSPEMLHSIRVEWGDMKWDSFGNEYRLTGRLIVPHDETGTAAPIEWRQGVLVVIARTPDDSPDWLSGTDDKNSLRKMSVTERNGTFDVEVGSHEWNRRPLQSEAFQIGIVLATHELADNVETAEVTEHHGAIATSIRVQLFPEVPDVSPDLRAINDARLWTWEKSNQQDFIRAVNRLHRLGKSNARDVLNQYRAKCGEGTHQCGSDITGKIADVLFEPIQLKDRLQGPGKFFRFERAGLDNLRFVEQEAVEFVGEIPFLMTDGPQRWWCCGIGRDLETSEDRTVLRDDPLEPTCHPLNAADALIRSHRVRSLHALWKQESIESIRFQAVHAVKDLLETKVKLCDDLQHISNDNWRQYLTAANELQIEWSVEEQRFVIGVEASGRSGASP